MSWGKKSKWIWINTEYTEDVYGEFFSSFQYTDGEVKIRISVDSNYTLFLNGKFIESGQYPDFPHYKVYDDLDITKYCSVGDNKLAIVVWYYGKENMSYFPGKASLRFEVYSGDNLLSYSSTEVLSRLSLTYQNGICKNITGQLGFTFKYDATKEDDWLQGNLIGFEKSVEVEQNIALYPRAIKKVHIGHAIDTKMLINDGKHFLIDLKREEVGYLSMRVSSSKNQLLTICYGEHITDGGVRRLIDNRDFSVQVVVGEGITDYTNYFRRLGVRYLEVFAEYDIEVERMSILPTVYPLNKVKKTFEKSLHQKIYDVSMRTLELCMHDHYEDCPWREQGLYAMDSRNQMLCGYYAFEEFDFPRDNLYLMSKDNRSDGLLSICVPSSVDLTIPSFSLHYFTQVYEYTVYSKDTTLARTVFPKLKEILNVFLMRMNEGLVPNFTEKKYWNFYEWVEDLSGSLGKESVPQTDAALNCLLSMALGSFQRICDLIGEKNEYFGLENKLNTRIREQFFDDDTGLYYNSTESFRKSELVNALAIICGSAKGEEARKIASVLSQDNDLDDISLSMLCFKFDALLKVDSELYHPYILKTIEEKYKVMLDADATSFWETELGESDFDNAGSLCHGWSAMPIYYLNLLLF